MTVTYCARYLRDQLVYEEQNGKVITNLQSAPAEAGHYVMGDIQPYQSMQTGEMIMGRRQHREHLKEHRLIEIGNEPIREQRPQSYNSDEVKRELARHIYK